MRIGIFTEPVYYRIWGGTNRVVYELVTRLAQIDKENEYVLFNTSGQTDASAFGIDRKNFRTVAIPGGRKLRWTRWSLPGALPVEHWTGPLDVMHTPFHFVPPCRAPFVVTILDTIIIHEPAMFTPQLRYFNAQTFRRATKAAAIACISESTKKDVLAHTGVSEDKLKVVHIGVSGRFSGAPGAADEASRIRAKLGIKGDYFLNLGVIQPRKNQVRLIKAYEIFRAQRPEDKTQLVLAGQKGWITDEFDKAVAASPMKDDIIVTGLVDDCDVPALMRCAKAFVFPTLLEGFGLPALEAMASGVPLVASDIPVLREIAEGCAVFVDPLDERSIAAGLARAAADETAAGAMAARGLERARDPRFTWDRMAESYLEIYKEAAKSAKR